MAMQKALAGDLLAGWFGGWVKRKLAWPTLMPVIDSLTRGGPCSPSVPLRTVPRNVLEADIVRRSVVLAAFPYLAAWLDVDNTP